MSEKIIARIGALLAQAESTSYGPEAQAFIEKAQELATLHAVDVELARVRRRAGQAPQLVQRQIDVWPVGSPGGKYQVWLFGVIAACNDVRFDAHRRSSYVIAFGYAHDVDQVERLWASLSVQMLTAANEALRAGAHRRAGVDARVYRGSFYDGFRDEISTRLQAARERALAQHAAAPAPAGSTSGELVLVAKAARVGEFYQGASEARGIYRAVRSSQVRSARDAGRHAGRRARLGAPELSQRGQLPAG